MTVFRVWAPAADARRGGGRRPAATRWHAAAGPGLVGGAEADVAGDGTDYAFRLDGGEPLADPRSPRQPDGPAGASRTYDHSALHLDRPTAGGARPLHGAVIYELHVGTFTPEGTLRRRDRAA